MLPFDGNDAESSTEFGRIEVESRMAASSQRSQLSVSSIRLMATGDGGGNRIGSSCWPTRSANSTTMGGQVLKVERNWLIHGMGEVQGEEPIVEHPDDSFVAILSVAIRPSMGGGHLVEHEPVHGRPYHFQRSWISRI